MRGNAYQSVVLATKTTNYNVCGTTTDAFSPYLASNRLHFSAMTRRRRGLGLLAIYIRVRSKLIKPRMRGETFRRWVARNMDNSLLSSILDIVQVGMG